MTIMGMRICDVCTISTSSIALKQPLRSKDESVRTDCTYGGPIMMAKNRRGSHVRFFTMLVMLLSIIAMAGGRRQRRPEHHPVIGTRDSRSLD